jgi:Domain of unknown function (DUF4397)
MIASRLTASLARLLAAGAVSLGLLALAVPAASASPAAAVSKGTGWLRLAHLSTNTPAVDVYLYSFGDPSAMVVLKHVAYGDVSPYERVPAGEYTVAMRGAGASPTSKAVLSTSINVEKGEAYTVAGLGPYSGLRLQVLDDKLATPKGKSLIRVIQASMHQERVTVTLNGTALADDLAFSHVSSYDSVSPGTLKVHVAGPSESTTKTIKLTSGSIHTLVILDGSPGKLGVDDLTDGDGSAVEPVGGAQTGFGGMAAQPGAPLLPWAGAGAVGLLAVAGGVFLVSRRRRPAMHAR